MIGFRVGVGGRPDQGSPSVPVVFAAIAGATVALLFPLVQGSGVACPQGEHTKSAVLEIANVSVRLLGFHALSDLQKPFNIGTPMLVSRYTLVPSEGETDGPDSRL